MIRDIVNTFSSQYAPSFSGGLSNHLPMAQVALYKLINDIEAVNILSNHYVAAAGLEPVESSHIRVVNIEDQLGHPQAYAAYVDFFTNRASKLGITDTIKESMIVLEDGHAGAAFHSMIKLAYAIETENDDEIIRALAYFASEYLPLPVTEHSVAISDMEDAFSKVMSDVYYHNFKPIPGLITTRLLSVIEDQHFVTLHFKLEGDVESQYKAMASYAVKEFLRTGDFLELHTITALHAMDVLKPYFNDFTKVMQTYVTAYIGSLLTIKTRDNGVMTHITRVKEWDDALYYIKQTMDVHTIKFLYTCRELDKKYCLDTLMTAVNIRFGQDKMINR